MWRRLLIHIPCTPGLPGESHGLHSSIAFENDLKSVLIVLFLSLPLREKKAKNEWKKEGHNTDYRFYESNMAAQFAGKAAVMPFGELTLTRSVDLATDTLTLLSGIRTSHSQLRSMDDAKELYVEYYVR